LARRRGATDAQISAADRGEYAVFDAAWKGALHVADEMTESGGQIPPALYAELAAAWTPAQIVEITMVIAAFNMFNRFANALEIPPTR
jgi:alkylhydroperoxidase family enzyme